MVTALGCPGGLLLRLPDAHLRIRGGWRGSFHQSEAKLTTWERLHTFHMCHSAFQVLCVQQNAEAAVMMFIAVVLLIALMGKIKNTQYFKKLQMHSDSCIPSGPPQCSDRSLWCSWLLWHLIPGAFRNVAFFQITLRQVILLPFNGRANRATKIWGKYCGHGFFTFYYSTPSSVTFSSALTLSLSPFPKSCLSWVSLWIDALQIFGLEVPWKYIQFRNSNVVYFGREKFEVLCVRTLSICPLKLYASSQVSVIKTYSTWHVILYNWTKDHKEHSLTR